MIIKIISLLFLCCVSVFASRQMFTDAVDPGCASFIIQTANTDTIRLSLGEVTAENESAYWFYQFFQSLKADNSAIENFVSVVMRIEPREIPRTDRPAPHLCTDLAECWYYSAHPLHTSVDGAIDAQFISHFRSFLDRNRVARIYASDMTYFLRMFHIKILPPTNETSVGSVEISFQRMR